MIIDDKHSVNFELNKSNIIWHLLDQISIVFCLIIIHIDIRNFQSTNTTLKLIIYLT